MTRKNRRLVKKTLRELENALMNEDISYIVWDIITALRGPDDDNTTTKAQTTMHIRRRAFPRLASKPGIFPAVFNTASRFGIPSSAENHFARHIRHAVHALDSIER